MSKGRIAVVSLILSGDNMISTKVQVKVTLEEVV